MSDPAELEARIAATRADLVAAVDELAGRISPRSVQARGRAAVQERLTALRDRLTSEGGPPLPQIGAAVGGLLVVLLVLRRRHGR
jgi:hypothetical protein